MNQPKGKKCRPRCCECRCWFTPAPSAVNRQKTCSKNCRLRRRAGQERARREVNLVEARAADVVRQREHRKQNQGREPKTGPMSQAGLGVQVADAIGEIMAKVRQEQSLSQAGLRRQLCRFAQLACGGIEQSSAENET